MTDLLKRLAEPFPPSQISWRVGPVDNKDNPTKGIALAYLDARDVQDRLDAVCGTGWQSRYPHADKKTVCEIGIKIGDEWIWRSDGAGDTDMEAEKGSLSDAFKRAAVKWGIGRYLYDAQSPWVQVVKKGRSVVIADSEMARLQKLLPGSKATTAPPEPMPVAPPPEDFTQRKNAPGVSKVRTWVNQHVHDLHGCESGAQFMEMVEAERERWVKVKAIYPNLWEGPDGSGLRGEALKQATAYECRQSFDLFLKEVEAEAADYQQPKAAE